MTSTAFRPAIRVVLADDHNLVRHALRALIEMIEGVQVVGDACDGLELVRAVKHLQPDMVLTDVAMPGMDGLAAVAHLRIHHPQVRSLVISMHDSVQMVRRLIAAGANGFLVKSASPNELARAIRCVTEMGSYFSPDMTLKLLCAPHAATEDNLTERQLQILVLLAQGQAAKEIAHSLGLRPKTVDVHRARIMARLNLKDLPSLVLYTLRKGLITD